MHAWADSPGAGPGWHRTGWGCTQAGRYRLNDLHEAAGGAVHHQPAKFFAVQNHQELIEELKRNSPNSETLPVNSVVGRSGGTYVVKQLVYAYAMWISPSFHLKVIDAFDAMVTQQQPCRS